MGKTISPKAKFPFAGQRKRQLKQDLEHITEEMYRRNKELADTNRTLSLLRAIDAIVLESHTSIKQVTADIAAAITRAMEWPVVGILLRSARVDDELVLDGWSIPDNAQAETLLASSKPIHLKLAHAWFDGPDKSRIINLADLPRDLLQKLTDCTDQELDVVEQTLQLKSLYLTKLIVRHHLVGLLAVGFRDNTAELSESNSVLLDRLSDSVGVALDNKLLFEENRYVLRQLRESNAKLVALDQTKDDFISMASHQLRTPLTAIKGYLSMVLEGDAGKLNATQADMLKQSFASSQRMVFLITDLLNVSRLKTGKFIVDPVPTNLANVVTEELDQLHETAQIKNLKLLYKKPEGFPELMLDDVKIRQVIMNFVDNAIYYTPAGGKITVELTDTPTAVELRVVDNGIGVPRSEQHHLFTKFYRATNARKARPDGTGLGLFMAQKVVTAHGGTVIFSSAEGKGSTFGFSFPKSKLRVPDAPKAVSQPVGVDK